jgi:hypothetical protein
MTVVPDLTMSFIHVPKLEPVPVYARDSPNAADRAIKSSTRKFP